MQCITNFVSMDLMANTLLAAGVGPNLLLIACISHEMTAYLFAS